MQKWNITFTLDSVLIRLNTHRTCSHILLLMERGMRLKKARYGIFSNRLALRDLEVKRKHSFMGVQLAGT